MQTIVKKATLVLGNPSVTDGLVAHFDGIWNAGLGRHDPTATEWTDLVSGNHTISSAAISFAPDALIIQSSAISINLNSDAAIKAISSGEFTIEVVGFIETFAAWRFHWIADAPGNKSALNIDFMTHSEHGMFILAKLGNLANVVSHGVDIAPCAAYGNIVAHLSDQTTHNVSFYENARYQSHRKCSVPLSPTTLYIDSVAKGPVGKYHVLRIYSRPISEAEITTNYEIDCNRFHLN